MPQMMPMYWVNFLMFLIFMIYIMIFMLYFLIFYKMNFIQINIFKLKWIWQW